MTQQFVNITKFAERVERLCDFFLAKISEEAGTDNTNDLKVINDLKQDAANIQFNRSGTKETLTGLYDYMNGVPNESSP